jgi:hypothetical protein
MVKPSIFMITGRTGYWEIIAFTFIHAVATELIPVDGRKINLLVIDIDIIKIQIKLV